MKTIATRLAPAVTSDTNPFGSPSDTSSETPPSAENDCRHRIFKAYRLAVFVTCFACFAPALVVGLEERYGLLSRFLGITSGPLVSHTIASTVALSLAAGLFVRDRDWQTRFSYSLGSLAIVIAANCAGVIAAVLYWGPVRE